MAKQTQQIVVYCEHCGVAPGKPTRCLIMTFGEYVHKFATSRNGVFCKDCGMMPGEPRLCTTLKFGVPFHRWEEIKS